MERYTPTLKDLAPRDIVARSMALEIREGRGAGPNKDYLYLDITHLEPEVIDEKLPDITEFARTYLGVEPVHRAGARAADRALRDGRHPDQRQRRGAARQHRPSFPASTPPASARASRCTAPTASAPTRCSTSTCSASAPARTPSSTCRPSTFIPLPDEPGQAACSASSTWCAARSTAPSASQSIRKELQDSMDRNAQIFRTDESLEEVTDAHRDAARALQEHPDPGQGQAVQHRPARGRRARASCSTSPRWSSTPRAPARRAAAATCARTTRSATTRTSWCTRWPTSSATPTRLTPATTSARLEAGRDHSTTRRWRRKY